MQQVAYAMTFLHHKTVLFANAPLGGFLITLRVLMWTVVLIIFADRSDPAWTPLLQRPARLATVPRVTLTIVAFVTILMVVLIMPSAVLLEAIVPVIASIFLLLE